MNKISITLHVFFEDPFWIGVFEFGNQKEFVASKVVFGKEPKETELFEFVLKQFHTLSYSPSVEIVAKKEKSNFKRKQRNARKEMQATGVGTKSQQALKLQQEVLKKAKCVNKKELKKHHKEKIFELKQLKKKAKQKGR